MSKGVVNALRKRQPHVYKKVKQGAWKIVGRSKGGHIWLVHIESGRRVTAAYSPSCSRAEANLLKIMDRFERGEFRW